MSRPTGDLAAMRMMQAMLMPLHTHADLGFGAMGDSFWRAAEVLSKAPDSLLMTHSHLPTLYLYRHSIELFLKSSIITIEQRFGNQCDSDPTTLHIHDSERRLRNTHGIKLLYAHLQNSLANYKEAIDLEALSDWTSPFPDTINSAIDLIDSYDTTSTFLRYPGPPGCTRDLEKSAFKPMSREAMADLVAQDPSGMLAVVFVDDEGEVTKAYNLDQSSLAELAAALRSAAEFLRTVQLGLYVELAAAFKQ